MKKIIEWFKESNRWKHFAGGVLIGFGSNGLYCAAYTGAWVAIALEVKDVQWGGKADAVDFALTLAGVAVGYGLTCTERLFA